MIWITLLILCLIALLYLTKPLAHEAENAQERAQELRQYKAEIEYLRRTSDESATAQIRDLQHRSLAVNKTMALTAVPRRSLLVLFIGFIGLAAGIYAITGSPALTQTGALKPISPGPTQADIAAAQQMSPEDRTAMINAMVESLAAKMRDNPQDADGWIRLLRARIVMGQLEPLKADVEAMKDAFKDDPKTRDRILATLRPPNP